MTLRVMEGPALKPRSSLSPEQKAAFVLLLFLGLAGILLGFRSFGASLRRPFEEQIARTAGTYVSQEQRDAEELAALKTRDSDADGLTDYDEQFVYKTSAFLADSDSDSFDDKMEIFSGNDPNCPQGKTCGGTVQSSDASAGVTPQPSLEPASGPAPSATAVPSVASLLGGGMFQSEQDLADFLLAMPVEEIRAYLKQSGLPEEDLNKLSDEDLKKVFAEAIQTALKEGQFKEILAPKP